MTGREKGSIPGTRIVRWIGILVPPHRRADWLAERQSELMYTHGEARARQARRTWTALRLRIHALGALQDALWLRREYGPGGHMRGTWKEATRVLRRQPVFALMVVSTLAVGIGAATSIFSVLDALVLRPPPFRNPDQLVSLSAAGPAGLSQYLSIDDANVWMQHADVFDALHLQAVATHVLTRPGEPRALRADLIQPGFLRMLGVAPALGREFAQEETVPGRDHGLIIGAAGLAIGLATTAILSRAIASLLFEVPRHDPITIAATSAVLLVACTAALILPARRAARVDAAQAMRVE